MLGSLAPGRGEKPRHECLQAPELHHLVFSTSWSLDQMHTMLEVTTQVQPAKLALAARFHDLALLVEERSLPRMHAILRFTASRRN